MAGEDFLPVGVRAIVQNVDDFIADMGRMERAVRDLGTSIDKAGRDVISFGTATTRAEAQAQSFDAMLLRMRQHEDLFSTSTRSLAKAILDLANSLMRQEPSMNRFSAGLQRARLAGEQGRQGLLRHVTSLDIFRNKIEQLRATQERSRATLAANTAAYKQNEGVVRRLAQLKKNLEERIKRENEIQGRLNAQLTKASTAYKKATGDLSELNKKTERFTQVGGTAAERAEHFGAAEMRLGDQAKDAQADIHNLSGALSANGERLNHLQAALGATSGRLQAASANSGVFAAAMTVAGQSINKTAIGMLALTALIGGLTVAATAASAAVSILKAAFTVLKNAIRAVGKALLLVNSAFIFFVGAVKGINRRVKNAAKLMFRWGNSIRFLGTSITFLVSLPIIGFLGALVKSSIDFEAAFAGVIKTVDSADFRLITEGSSNVRDLTEKGIRLERNIRDLALIIPISAIELAKLGEVAGTLGVRGIGNLTQFIDTTAKLGVTTDVTSEDAARAFAKIISISGGLSDAELSIRGFSDSQIEGMSKSERFQISVESLGGVLVDLGNKTPAVESTILDMTRQMAATSNVVGITTNQTFAMAAAFDATGATAVRAKTTYQRVMFDILGATQEGGVELEIFAKTAGQTVEEFVKGFEEDAAGTFLRFTQGLGAQGDDAVRTLEALDLADNRVMQTILSLANAEGVLANELNLATNELEAQADGMNALEIEAAKRFSTVESQLILLKNQFAELGISIKEIVLPPLIKLIAWVKELIKRIGELDPVILKTVITILLLVAAFGPIVTAVGLVMATFGFLIVAITSVIGAILSIATSLGLLALPIFLVIGAIIGLAIAFAAAFKKMDRFADTTAKSLATKLFEFGKNIILAFARGMAKALIAIVMVLNAIGEIISKWLRPGSPPKLLPDLDDWGENAMLIYMEGWASADFGIFNTIADKIEGFLRSIGEDVIPKDSLVSRILGTRRVIASVLKQIKKVGKVTGAMLDRIERAMGGTSQRARAYVRALLDVAAASEKVRRAQEELSKITKKYDDALKPISDRLRQISRRQQEVADAMRIAELEAILGDPRATELVRELAKLELEQIGLEADSTALEDARDIETERVQLKLDAAEAEKKAAEETLAVTEAMLDVQTKNNQLVNEMIQAIDKLASKLGKLGKLDAGAGDIAGVDPDAFEIDPAGDLEDLLDLTDLEDSISDSIAGINDEFAGLVTELKEIFAPLLPLWDELGETWAPIIEKILLFVEDLLPASKDVSTAMEEWQTKVGNFADGVAGLLDGALGEFFSILVDLGAIEPFGPLVERAREAEGPLSKIGQTIERIKQFFRDLWQSIQDAVAAFMDLGLVHFLIESLHAILEGLEGPIARLVQGFKDFWGSLGKAVKSIKDAIDRAEGLKRVIGAIIKVVITIGLALSSFVRGVITGIVGAITKAVGFLMSGLGLIIEGIASVLGGVIKIVSGIFEVIGGIIELFKGNTEEGKEILLNAWRNIRDGVVDIIKGLATTIAGILVSLVGTVFGLISGFVEGFVNFFKDLWDRLVGHSIVTDIVNGILGLFTFLFVEIPLMIAGFVLDAIGQFAQFILDVLAAIGGFVADVIQWFADLALDVLTAIGLFVIDVVTFFTELPGEILGALSTLAGDIGGIAGEVLQWFVDLPGEILDALSSFASLLFDVGKDLVGGLVDGIGNLAGSAVDAVVGVGEDILGGIGDFFGIGSPSKEMEDIGEDVMGGWIEGVEGQAKALLSVFTEMADNIVKLVVEALTTMVRLWTELLAGILPVTNNWATAIVRIFTEMGMVIFVGNNSIIAGWLTNLGIIWNEMLQVTLDWIFDMQVLLSEFFWETLEMLEDLQEDFKLAGQNLMQSLAAGLWAGAEAAYFAARTIASNIQDIIDNVNQAGSPSRVFIKIGENLVSSWAMGMKNARSELLATASRLAESTQAIAQPAGPQVLGSSQASVAPVVPAGSVSNITQAELNMGGQTISTGIDVVMFTIALEQALRNVLD